MASSLPPASEDDTAQPAVEAVEAVEAVQIVVGEVVVAKLAADVAARTPGVARLEPGVGGVLTQFGRWGREQVTGVPELPHEGVRAQLDAGGARVYLNIVTEGTRSTHLVAHRLRGAVAHAIPRLLGVSVIEVGVTVLSIDTAAGLTVHTSDGEHHDGANAPRTGSGLDQDPQTIPAPTGTGHHRSAEPPTHRLGSGAGEPSATTQALPDAAAPQPSTAARREVEQELAAVVAASDGVRLATRLSRAPRPTSGQRYWDALAVTVAPTGVDIDVIATAVPLTPHLAAVAARVRDALRGIAWSDAPIRLGVEDLDPAALPDPSTTSEAHIEA